MILYNFQQRQMVLSRDAMVDLAKQFRNQFKEFSETPIAFTALHSNDRNEDLGGDLDQGESGVQQLENRLHHLPVELEVQGR